MTGLAGWVLDVIAGLGYVGVALLVALENVFPPIPSEVVLPLAGFVSAAGEASLAAMVAAATAGSLAGAYVLYGLAAVIGPERLRTLVRRHGRWLGLEEGDLDRAEGWFDRRATTAVLVGRWVPVIRSLISIPAGLRRMPLIRFTVATALGSAGWNLALVGAGYLLGDNWRRAGEPVEVLQWIVLAGLSLAIAWFVWRRILSPRLRR